MTLTVGSLFSGIGGIDLGLERAGMTVKWQVEIDPYARQVLAKHWPDVVRHDDVRHVGAHNLEPVDLIAGGFPCQDISFAGLGAGLAGERSGLWFEYARLIRELRPRYVLVENVTALLRRGLGRVLGDLAESGYDAEWECLPASAFGAPHRRDRIWIVAYPHSRRPERLDRFESFWIGRAGLDDSSQAPDLVADADSTRLQGYGRLFQCPCQCAPGTGCWTEHRAWQFEPPVGRLAHGIPRRVDRLRGLGNAVVPQAVTYIGKRIFDFDRALTLMEAAS